jgi:hypothetical protein
MTGAGNGLNVGMKRKGADGYRSSLRMQKQLAHLEELFQQEQQAYEDTHAQQMVRQAQPTAHTLLMRHTR